MEMSKAGVANPRRTSSRYDVFRFPAAIIFGSVPPAFGRASEKRLIRHAFLD